MLTALIGAIVWDLITWWYGIPSSSSHALASSIVGAGIAASGLDVIEFGGVSKVLEGLVLSPVLGFGAAFLLMLLLLNIFAEKTPAMVTRFFGKAQLLSAAYMAYSHGSNDAQKTMGVITMALASYYGWTGAQWQVPFWVILAIPACMLFGWGLHTGRAGRWRLGAALGV